MYSIITPQKAWHSVTKNIPQQRIVTGSNLLQFVAVRHDSGFGTKAESDAG